MVVRAPSLVLLLAVLSTCGRSSYGPPGGVCGDGELRPGVEECDDGNLDNADDCSSQCLRCDYPAAAITVGADGHCYSRHEGPVPLASAVDACTAVGGQLATFESAAQSDAVAAELLAGASTVYWLGLRAAWYWIDGTPFLFTSWAAGEPSNSTADRAAAQRSDAQWEVYRQDSPLGFLCEVAGWTLRPDDGHAYRASYQAVSWATAQSRCEEAGGHLAIIADSDEAVFVEERFPAPMWVGARAEMGSTEFRWIDDQPLDFERWLPNEPATDGSAASCASSQAIGWRGNDCAMLLPYLCEAD